MTDFRHLEERYHHDNEFRQIVDMIYAWIGQTGYTPSEIRDAAMCASLKFEASHLRPLTIEMEMDRMSAAAKRKFKL